MKLDRYTVLVPLIFAAALVIYKSQGSWGALQRVVASGTMSARPEIVAFGDPSSVTFFQRSINYFIAVWPALAFGVLIGAGVRAFVSPSLLSRMFTGGGMKAQLTAGLAGAPLMLCSCCVAPVFTAVYERSQRLAPSIAMMLASPSLNPAALILTFLLFNPMIATARLLMAILAVGLTGPVVERFFPGKLLSPMSDPNRESDELTGSAVSRFVRALGSIAVRVAPTFTIGVLTSMILVEWLPADFFVSSTTRLLTIFIVAAIALPLALPTFLEIPLALSFLAAGLPAAAAAAFLFAGPAINLPSLFGVARSAGWKAAIATAVTVWMIAVAVGSFI